MNNKIALIMGNPGSGKSSSLRNIREPEGVVYFNFDGKGLPFKSKFKEVFIEDVADIFDYLNEIKEVDKVHTIVIDTITFMMDQFESQYVVNSTNTLQQWGAYAQFYKQVMHKLKASGKNVIVLAHEKKVMNEEEMVLETKVPIKGAVGNLGVEADFMMSGAKGSFEDTSGATSAGRSEINYFYSLRARAGYRFDSWDTLVYLTAGYGGADVDLYGGPAGSVPTDGYTAHYHGGVFGGGLEKAFGKNVRIRFEYRYSNLGSKSGSLAPTYSLVEMPVKLKVHQFIGAVYYQFWDSGFKR